MRIHLDIGESIPGESIKTWPELRDHAFIHMDHDPPQAPKITNFERLITERFVDREEQNDVDDKTDQFRVGSFCSNLLFDELSDILGGIHGVSGFTSGKYLIVIKKGQVFSWQEVLPRVINALCEFFSDYQVEINDEHANMLFPIIPS